ncbi:MAG TPA: glutamyl-tRNA reductase [Candidatus Dormibacteraeota bacterium]
MQRTLLSLALGPGEAELALRERASLSAPEGERLLAMLGADPAVEGTLVLSTCGRTEVYVSGLHPAALRKAVLRSLRAVHGKGFDAYSSHLAERRDGAAALHLFRVASGLESPLLGESQILGQVRVAARQARAAGALDPLVGGTADRAIAAARRARQESGLGRGAASIGQAAVALLREVCGEVAGAAVLVVGAGEIGTLAARALSRTGAELLVASRTRASADSLALRAGGETVPLDELMPALARVDAAVFCASAAEPLLGVEALDAAVRGRRDQLLLLDLAVPRNIPPAAGELPNVKLVNVDEVATFADAGLSRRRAAAGDAATILDEELEAWEAWKTRSAGAATLAALAAYADGIRSREVQRTLRALGEIDPELRLRIESLSRALVTRLMLHPISYVRAHPEDEAAGELLQRLFSEPPNRTT